MNKLHVNLTLCSVLLITACVPIYQPDDLKKTVAVKAPSTGSLMICKNNEWYRLKEDQNGFVRLPVDKRISIASSYYKTKPSGIMIENVSCSPRLSFIPKAGNLYYANFYIEDDTCNIEIVRYSKQNKTGFAAEESVSSEEACL